MFLFYLCRKQTATIGASGMFGVTTRTIVTYDGG